MVNISKTRRNFIWWHTLFAVTSRALGIVVLHFALSGHYFGGYPLIPIYLYFLGLSSIYAFDTCRRYAPQRMSLLYLTTKMIEMILLLILVLIYHLAAREEARAFLLTFILFYLIYLVFETRFFFPPELNQRRKRKNKKKNETVA